MNFDVHVGTEDAGGDIVSQPAQLFDKIVDQGFGLFGACSVGVGRPSAFPRIAIECELRDDQNAAADLAIDGAEDLCARGIIPIYSLYWPVGSK